MVGILYQGSAWGKAGGNVEGKLWVFSSWITLERDVKFRAVRY
jgi:hypothetical protein